VHEKQFVKIRPTAYPFQKYGSVSHLCPDAADPPGTPTKRSGETTDSSGGLRYKALIHLDAQHLETDGQRMRLSPGMQVVVEIQQGRRTVMEYLLSPVQKAWQEAARER
jgi:hemolysin D